MKKLILTLFALVVLFGFDDAYSQSHQGVNVQYAFERRVYKRWDKFRPWWWFKIVYRKYDNEDRRNILQLVPTVVQTSITKDYTESQKKSVDTIFRAKVIDAIDRVNNKRWILFDERKVNEHVARITEKLERGNALGWSTSEQLVLGRKLLAITESIETLLGSFIPDADKSLQIHKLIKELEDFDRFLDFYIKIQSISNFQNTPIEDE
ncbi:MAG: hypothetical protein AAGA43_15725 [Bacteroidota bacterium]